ncbi:MAG: helix-turn-helix domain-containing protein [Gluconacetobacter diazotrophicus]|nr:helix-turn-helix domain-containing protein [Gluconacetobacter diazotrophicus]
MRKPSLEERRTLGAFLADRRARLQPGEVGLPAGQRRTPGLRREEVAVLAGVSVSWYTWLEQGRDIQASADTLRRVAAVLRLDRAEAAHLFALSARDAPVFPSDEQELSNGLMLLVRAMDPIPAYVRNSRFDILAWNDAVAEVFVDYGSLAPHERNTVRLLFLHPSYRTLIVDWERMARGYVAAFRAARARAAVKEPFDRLAAELGENSAEFRRWWSEVEVASFDEGEKSLRHPTLGSLRFTFIALASEKQPELSVVAYILRRPSLAAGGESRS